MKPYEKARTGCLLNVNQYIRDIEKLLEVGSYGHAYGLAIIAGEELTKAFIYHCVCNRIVPPTDALLKKLVKGGMAHQRKILFQEFFPLLPDLTQWMTSRIKEPLKQVVGEQVSSVDEVDDRVLEDIVMEVCDHHIQPLLPEWLKQKRSLLEKPRKVQKMKEDALYVGIKNGKVHSPTDFPRRKAFDALKALKINLEETTESMKNLQSQPSHVKRILAEVYRRTQ